MTAVAAWVCLSCRLLLPSQLLAALPRFDSRDGPFECSLCLSRPSLTLTLCCPLPSLHLCFYFHSFPPLDLDTESLELVD